MSQLQAKDFPQSNTLIAKGQNEYHALPAFLPHVESKSDNPQGMMTVCWELTPKQLEEINKTGCIWHSTMAFWQGYQPVILQTDSPFEGQDLPTTEPPANVEKEALEILYQVVKELGRRNWVAPQVAHRARELLKSQNII